MTGLHAVMLRKSLLDRALQHDLITRVFDNESALQNMCGDVMQHLADVGPSDPLGKDSCLFCAPCYSHGPLATGTEDTWMRKLKSKVRSRTRSHIVMQPHVLAYCFTCSNFPRRLLSSHHLKRCSAMASMSPSGENCVGYHLSSTTSTGTTTRPVM